MKATENVEGTKSATEARAKLKEAIPEHHFDPEAFDAAITRWMGSGRERMRELGFATTEDYMNAIRGRSE